MFGHSNGMHTRTAALARGTLLLLLLSTGYQSHGADGTDMLPTSRPDKAVVVLYREDKLAYSAVHYRPYVNDVAMPVLTRGTWAYALVPAGSYDLWLEQYAPAGHPQGIRSRAVTTHDWRAGNIYYIKVDSMSMPGLVSRAIGTQVDAARALKEIGELAHAGNPLHYPVIGK